ncbi:pyridoxine/pyridoxamine 5'-phosphate oxidase [Kineosporia succinea]|uniref:Pyridoxamine 5'-phosphate oxidase n=1 Tax=Kineosporia succinea TaxID=84632 RepID=A0ABT9PDD2_9ACTN|nr:pyridoxal 5'-phosphate synthase [Kineosporia succinea]MDP9830719.1 pyridoxamine 5'-phosphate oxidase [Kineosporia succinea]
MSDLRQYLRTLKVFEGDLPTFDPATAPDHPEDLFVEWLHLAVSGGVREPHALTLSTTGLDGLPSARVLILKNLDEHGWQFAVHAASPKGRELQATASAALTFHWREQARQIRVRGPVVAADPGDSAADFLARPAGSRAEALIGRQSQVLGSPAELGAASDRARERLAERPDLVEPAWTLYSLRARTVEFWQGDAERRHVRLRFTATGTGWEKERLWP